MSHSFCLWIVLSAIAGVILAQPTFIIDPVTTSAFDSELVTVFDTLRAVLTDYLQTSASRKPQSLRQTFQ